MGADGIRIRELRMRNQVEVECEIDLNKSAQSCQYTTETVLGYPSDTFVDIFFNLSS